MSIFTYQNAFHRFKIAHNIKDGTFLCTLKPISALLVKQSPSTSINPEKCSKTAIFTLPASSLCTWLIFCDKTAYYTLTHSLLYLIVFSACRCDPPLPTNQPRMRSMQARFSQFSFFTFPNVKRMAHARTCHGRPTTRIGPKI